MMVNYSSVCTLVEKGRVGVLQLENGQTLLFYFFVNGV